MKPNFKLLIVSLFLLLQQAYPFNISFQIQPTEQVSLEGFRAKFDCLAVSSPVKTITYLWKFNGQFINTNLNRRFLISKNGSLEINNVVTEDFGIYQCIAQCEDGSIISQPAKLEKAAFRLYESITRKTYSEKEGVPFFLKAPSYDSKPPAKAEWKICKFDTCRSDPTRFFVTTKGDLLISALLSTDNGYSFSLVISPKFHNPQTFRYGDLRVSGALRPGACPDETVEFFPTQRNFSINEGQNVSLDCLAVLKRCGFPLNLAWKRSDWGPTIGTSRRYQILNAQKGDEGQYKCFAAATGAPNRTYNVNVAEKPKLTVEPPNVWSLHTDGVVPFGTVRNLDYLHWYTNAERITGDTAFFEVLSNNSLQIKFFSKSLSGIYQIFYYNKAGVISRTIRVDVNNDICGGKLTTSEGKIDFWHQKGLPNGLIQCIWLIQIPASRYVQLNFTKFDFNGQNIDCNQTKLTVYEGLVSSNTSNKQEFCYENAPGDGIVMAGPYITVSVIAYGSDLANGGFKMLYRFNNSDSTTAPPTTISTTIASSSPKSSSTKQSTAPRTTTKTTTQTVKSSTQSTVRKTTSVKPKTTQTTKSSTPSTTTRTTSTRPKTTQKTTTKTTKAHSSTRNRFPIVTSTTNTHSNPKEKTSKVTTASPRKAKNKDDNNAVTFGAIGGAAGAILIIVIIIAVVCYRRKASKLPVKTSIPKEMAIIGSRGSFSNGKYNKRSTAIPPILKYDGINSVTSETCFTLKEKKRMSRSSYPDVIPASESPRYEMGFLGPGHDAIREEDYTELGIGTSTATNKRISRLKEENSYIKLEPSDGNQYEALMSSSLSSNSSVGASHNSLPVYSSAGYSSPLYHTLESEDNSMAPNTEPPTYQVLEDENSKESFYNSLEVDEAANKTEPTYHVLQDESSEGPVYNSLDVNDSATNKQEPTYQVLEDGSYHEPVYNSVESDRTAKTTSKDFDPRTDYLQPVQPRCNGGNTKRGLQPISNEPVYHILTEDNKEQPVYCSTDYIEPNPVNEKVKSVIKRSNGNISNALIGSSAGAKRDDTYEPLASISDQQPVADNIYQPIFNNDSEYMPIIPESSNAEKHKNEDIYNPAYQPLGDTKSDDIYTPLS